MLRFKVNVMALLKEAGYSSTRMRNERIFGEATMTKMRHGVIVSMNELAKVCELTGWQPGDLVEYVKEEAQ